MPSFGWHVDVLITDINSDIKRDGHINMVKVTLSLISNSFQRITRSIHSECCAFSMASIYINRLRIRKLH